jgi:uncharacterized protein (DUF1697 family)
VSPLAGRQAALLRGVNVGPAKRVAMADLRALVEGLGYADVHTVLNSGNVVYTARGVPPAAAATRIGEALAARLGVHALVVALSAAELTVAVADNPLAAVADNPSRLLVAVPADPRALTRLEPLLEQDWAPEALALGARVAYLWCPAGVIASRVSEAVGRTLGDAVTSRNWTTMTKLQALAGGGRG